MKLVVTGAGGQLGQELIGCAENSDLEVVGVTRQELDITSASQINSVLTKHAPGIVINAAAYTKVDAAETDRERAYAVNTTAAGLLAQWCQKSKCILIHLSTDYVFDGQKKSPYIETDPIGPLNVYGTTKAQGEALVRKQLSRHVIVRTSWLYGNHGQNFVKTIIGLARNNEVLRIVADQYGSPTSAVDLAEAILSMAGRLDPGTLAAWGTYHYCCRGVVSWHDFAAEIIRQMPLPHDGRAVRTEPIPTEAYPTAAKRPQYSGLDCRLFETTFGRRPLSWTDALTPVVSRLMRTA